MFDNYSSNFIQFTCLIRPTKPILCPKLSLVTILWWLPWLNLSKLFEIFDTIAAQVLSSMSLDLDPYESNSSRFEPICSTFDACVCIGSNP